MALAPGSPAASGFSGADASTGAPTQFLSGLQHAAATGEYWRAENLPVLASCGGPISVSYWHYSVPFNTGIYLSFGSTSSGWQVRATGNGIEVAAASSGVAHWTASPGYANDFWRLWTITYDGTTARLYLNGLEYTTSASAPDTPNVSVFAIFGNCHSGFIDSVPPNAGAAVCDVRLWNRVLTAREVWALYDPATRWELYWVPGRTLHLDMAGAVAAGVRNGYYLPLMGVA